MRRRYVQFWSCISQQRPCRTLSKTMIRAKGFDFDFDFDWDSLDAERTPSDSGVEKQQVR